MEVHALYVFRGGSGSTENLMNLSIVFRATHFPGDDAQPAESVLPCCKTLLIQRTAWEDCSLLFSPINFRGWFWVTAPFPWRVAQKSAVSPFLSCVCTEKPGTLLTWLRDGTLRGSDPVGQTKPLSNCINLKWPYLLLRSIFS